MAAVGRPARSPANETELELIGGTLCLDFVNTVDPRHGNARSEYLTDYRALLSWAVRAGALGMREAAKLRAEARRHPRRARQVHRDAIALREHAYAIFDAVLRGVRPPARSVRLVNHHLAQASAKQRLVVGDVAPHWGWSGDRDLARVLWPILRSIADLLVGPVDRIRECPGDGTCGWLFLDTTKNGSRKWCEMRTCGNRAKARRYYERTTRRRPGTEPGDGRHQRSVVSGS